MILYKLKKPKLKKKIETEIDYLVTHSSFPEITSFPIKGEMVLAFAKYDQDLISDLENESQSIKNWVDSLIGNQKKKINYDQTVGYINGNTYI